MLNNVAIITKLKIRRNFFPSSDIFEHPRSIITRTMKIFSIGWSLVNIPLENKNVGEVTGAMFTYPDRDKMKLRYSIILCYKNVLFAVDY